MNIPTRDTNMNIHRFEDCYEFQATCPFRNCPAHQRNEVFRSQTEYQKHHSLKHERRDKFRNNLMWICPECGKHCSSFYNFSAHVSTHRDLCQPPWICTLPAVKPHGKYAGFDFEMSICGKRSSTKNNLKSHIMSVHKVQLTQNPTVNGKPLSRVGIPGSRSTSALLLHQNHQCHDNPPQESKRHPHGLAHLPWLHPTSMSTHQRLPQLHPMSVPVSSHKMADTTKPINRPNSFPRSPGSIASNSTTSTSSLQHVDLSSISPITPSRTSESCRCWSPDSPVSLSSEQQSSPERSRTNATYGNHQGIDRRNRMESVASNDPACILNPIQIEKLKQLMDALNGDGRNSVDRATLMECIETYKWLKYQRDRYELQELLRNLQDALRRHMDSGILSNSIR